MDDLVLPTKDGKANLSLIFRFDNDFLPYKKITLNNEIERSEDHQFYTIARLNAEIYKGRAKRRGRNDQEVTSRDLWVDTLYTKTFDETESKKLYASGSLTNTLEPGEYNYALQLSLMEKTSELNLLEKNNKRSTNRQNVSIVDWNEKKTGEILLVKEKTDQNTLKLMNMEDNVLFGKDFMALIRIPDFDNAYDYSLKILKVRANQRDTTKIRAIYAEMISKSDISTKVFPELTKGKDPSLFLTSSETGFTYALVSIPNSTFENAAYIVELTSSNGDEILAKSFFRSYWPDMPASLYNLDISIDMMKFIVSEVQLKDLKKGNAKQKEEKFRTFWESKDPTPGTVYNELMSEYYRRIDFAFKEFSNQGNFAGHESDQGEVYIKFGPPDSKERRFPTKGKVVEIWSYKKPKICIRSQHRIR